MQQAEAVVDLAAIKANTELLAAHTSAGLMAVVKADGYGHGMLPAARAVLAGGATWLGVCTIAEALTIREAGITAPMLAWLIAPGQPVREAIEAGVDLSAATVGQLREFAAAAREAGSPVRLHLKADTGLSRNGATPEDWPDVVTAAAKLAAEGVAEVVGLWSHFAYADAPGHPTVTAQQRVFAEALDVAARAGIRPQVRHLANSAATLSLPQSHFDLVRPGIALYGLSPIEHWPAARGLRPAMTLRARVALVKRVPPGTGVSYGHQYVTEQESTLALVPLGYADGIPRAAGNIGPIWVAGARRTISGRVSMDQIVVAVGDDPVVAGEEAIVFGPGDAGEPTADDWAAVLDTINYEIVTRVGSRVPRTYLHEEGA
jgi:alanine racemase